MNILQVDNLSLSFGGVHALADVSWQVEQGAIAGVIGPNGAGKTTLFNCVTGFLRPTRGSQVSYGGQDVTGWATHRLARAGLVRTFQHPKSFIGMTVRQNVVASTRLSAHRQDAEAILRTTELDEFADRRAVQCPYGVIRRLNMAMAMAIGPKLLMLDEPAAGLNDRERLALRRSILALREAGCTIVLVEHDMSFVMSLVDEVMVLDAGRVLTVGTPSQVTSHPDVIRVYLGQFDHAQDQRA
jgi:branched-chain amino acid transport system ATP-binding protein